MNERLKNKKLAVTFTRGVSFSIWDKVGLIGREILIYKRLSTVFDKIYFFTYGDKKDKQYQNLFSDNVIIIPKPRYIPSGIYVFLMPFMHRRIFREIDVIKTNQMDGSGLQLLQKRFLIKNC